MSEASLLQALHESAVVLESPGHDILRATGNDRVSFLQRITSGSLSGIEVGRGGRTLLLDVRGRVLASMLAFVRGKSVRLVVPAGQGADVAAGLSKYAIMDDFQILHEAELTTLAVLGPKAGQALEKLGIAKGTGVLEAPLYSHEEVPTESFGLLWMAHGRASGVDGLCLVASRSNRDAIASALGQSGIPTLASELADALRIEALEPAQGKEILPERFPVEVGLGKAIDHGKGCYVGQETIVRMRDRGIIRKRLVLLRLAQEGGASPGDKVAAEGQPNAGVVTSVGRQPGALPVALAIVASAVPVGASVQIQHAEAAVGAQVTAESPPWG
jgi:folate-binding protein YgfZ